MSTFKVQVFPRRDRLVRGSEVIHSEEFKTLAGAQKFCKRFMRGYRAKLCNYFFHIVGSGLECWFTLNGVKLVDVEDLKVDEELEAQKDEELEALNAQIAEISAQSISLQKQADEVAQRVYKQREVRTGVSSQIDYERSFRPSGFIDSLKAMNDSMPADVPTADRPYGNAEPGSLLEGYRKYLSETPNVGYNGPYVTIKMGSCGSGRYDPNTGKYNPHWHGG